MRRRDPLDVPATLRILVQLSGIDDDLREAESAAAAVERRRDEDRLAQVALEELVGRERRRLAAAESDGGDVAAIRTFLAEAERQLCDVTGAVARGQGAPPDHLAALAERRRVLLAQLPEDVAATYQVLARAGRHPVVAPIANEYCSACHLRIPPQLANAVASGRELARCPHCRRLLYAPRGDEAPHA